MIILIRAGTLYYTGMEEWTSRIPRSRIEVIKPSMLILAEYEICPANK